MTKYFILLLLFFSSAAPAAADSKFLSQIEKQINSSIEDKIQLSIEKNQLETQIKDIQEKIKDKKLIIIKRLKALYSLKQYKWGELLLNSNSTTLERNIKILKNLNKYDYDLFLEYNLSFKMLAAARKNLQETDLLIQEKVTSLKAQQDEFYKLEELRIAELNKEKKESLLVYKGHLARPLDGILKQEFGSIRDQNNQFYLINHGELYSTKVNAPVRSVGLGTIIFRDELMHWRETLIIQHDDNYYSVYAGVTNFKKSIGAHVEKNEVIGFTAGDSFYFELRHFENPINPKNWFYKESM